MSKFRHVQENFFTNEECDGFIKFSEGQGYIDAPINTRQGEVMDKEYRNNDRYVWDRPEVAAQMFPLMKDLVPPVVEGNGFKWEPCGLNERFRFYRYRDGQSFKPHVDGAFKRNDDEVSLITALIYLSEDFEGGSTYLIGVNENVVPKKGMLLLFDHKILHAGLLVTSGTKYVLRTDVMYRKIKEETNNETNEENSSI